MLEIQVENEGRVRLKGRLDAASAPKAREALRPLKGPMALDMTDEPLLLFRSPGKEHLNIVYRRQDGNIGWIDAANIKS